MFEFKKINICDCVYEMYKHGWCVFVIKLCSNIRVVPVGMSKAVKKLVRGQVPNLANYNDISDFVLRSVYLVYFTWYCHECECFYIVYWLMY